MAGVKGNTVQPETIWRRKGLRIHLLILVIPAMVYLISEVLAEAGLCI